METPRRILILIVDDETVTRADSSMAFEQAGFQVIEACDASEAIMVLQDQPAIEVVFTDVQMPGDIDGVTLAAIVSQLRPDTTIVVTSGAEHIQANTLPPGGCFVTKPYDPSRVAGMIRELVH